jgi:hypothetical protein
MILQPSAEISQNSPDWHGMPATEPHSRTGVPVLPPAPPVPPLPEPPVPGTPPVPALPPVPAPPALPGGQQSPSEPQVSPALQDDDALHGDITQGLAPFAHRQPVMQPRLSRRASPPHQLQFATGGQPVPVVVTPPVPAAPPVSVAPPVARAPPVPWSRPKCVLSLEQPASRQAMTALTRKPTPTRRCVFIMTGLVGRPPGDSQLDPAIPMGSATGARAGQASRDYPNRRPAGARPRARPRRTSGP